jgi:hypothetical protein
MYLILKNNYSIIKLTFIKKKFKFDFHKIPMVLYLFMQNLFALKLRN